jgi:hypothetical protein
VVVYGIGNTFYYRTITTIERQKQRNRYEVYKESNVVANSRQ